MKKITAFLAAGALGCVSAAGPANAQEYASENVEFGDLDLRNASGVSTFDKRISRAIVRVCGVSVHDSFYEWISDRQCQRDTLAAVQPSRNEAIEQAQSEPRGTVKIVRLTIKRDLGRN